jgi:hypothetical protein
MASPGDAPITLVQRIGVRRAGAAPFQVHVSGLYTKVKEFSPMAAKTHVDVSQ